MPYLFGFVNLLIKGVSAFIRSMEYITPSGNPPHNLITIVTIPQPMPKTHLPFFVIGDVTGSVAIKNAPIIKPPENKWNKAGAYIFGAAK